MCGRSRFAPPCYIHFLESDVRTSLRSRVSSLLLNNWVCRMGSTMQVARCAIQHVPAVVRPFLSSGASMSSTILLCKGSVPNASPGKGITADYIYIKPLTRLLILEPSKVLIEAYSARVGLYQRSRDGHYVNNFSKLLFTTILVRFGYKKTRWRLTCFL